MIKLLLVEDDASLSYMIKGSLEDMIGGYEVSVAANGKEGFKQWKEARPDIIITDIEMPEMDGFEMVQKIREMDGETLILFASGRVSPKDVTAAYQFGGNNYVKKPFIPEELDAHIKGMIKLRNELRFRNESRVRKIGSYSFDAINGTLRDKESNIVPITAKEARILQLLIMKKGETIKREVILEYLWDVQGKDYFASRSLDVFVANLRKKITDSSVRIETIRGVGLRIID